MTNGCLPSHQHSKSRGPGRTDEPRTCWCAGDCRGEVVASCGDWRQPSPHCDELREVYRWILWLLASGRSPLGVQRRAAGGTATADTFL